MSGLSEAENPLAALTERKAPVEVEGLVERCPILKGIGKIDGDGWKDTTKIGQVVFVWNRELPAPYSPGQYPRVGCEIWSASTRQYNFSPAAPAEVEALFQSQATELATLKQQLAEAVEHINEQATFAESRIQDGKDMGASVWRIALEDVARENRALTQKAGAQ